MITLVTYLDRVWYLIGLTSYAYCWWRFGRKAKKTIVLWRWVIGIQLLLCAARGDIFGDVIFTILLIDALKDKSDDDDDDDDDDGKPVGLELKAKIRRLTENLKNQLPSPSPQPV
jgi:hypothetical protein